MRSPTGSPRWPAVRTRGSRACRRRDASLVAPSGGLGTPAARCTSPLTATVTASRPSATRLTASTRSGCRISSTPRVSRTSGRARPTRPSVPATTACTTSPTGPGRPHHSRAATTSAAPMKASPSPSRRCAGSRSRAPLPTRRAIPPSRWAMAIHSPRNIRTNSGVERGPRRGLRRRDDPEDRPEREPERDEAPERPQEVPVERPRADDVRDAMLSRLRDRRICTTRHTPSGKPRRTRRCRRPGQA